MDVLKDRGVAKEIAAGCLVLRTQYWPSLMTNLTRNAAAVMGTMGGTISPL